METRKITIISTKNNKRTVINTDASTLGELKRALRDADIDYDGMTFYEGLTKTELLLDSSILPHDVQRINPVTKQPETTNELAFMLTNSNKKIKSGAMTRKDAYAAIKEFNFQDEILRTFGKNFTTCKTEDLINFIDNKVVKATELNSKPCKCSKVKSVKCKDNGCIDFQAREAITNIVDYLYNNDIIDSYSEKEAILNIFECNNLNSCTDSPYSNDELEDMFKDMLK